MVANTLEGPKGYPQELKPVLFADLSGTAEQVAEKVEIAAAAPKGVVETKRLRSSLKR
jgi:hypothetical protein